MDRNTEDRLAKAAYNWLKVSPVVTITTLFIIVVSDIGNWICDQSALVCDYDSRTYINFAIGVIGSSLWHLILLQYVNNEKSDFVRRHGRRALIQAGIRTGAAIFAVALDWAAGADGAFACIGVVALIVIWTVNIATSKKLVENELAELDLDAAFSQPEINSNEIIQTETNNNNDSHSAEDILNELLRNLQSDENTLILKAIASLGNLNYSSQAIRRQLEQLSINSNSSEVRNEALNLLNSAANRAVQKQINANKLDRTIRGALLREIDGWEQSSLIEKQTADVIRRRYDFDIIPAATKQAAPQPKTETDSAEQAHPTPKADTPAQIASEPRPTLLQTLTSEASIKIYLYLGAFFVIAAAAILGAAVPELRLPILIIGTFIFGGLAVVIKKRLPQPSFALFIVFSFLLPITANSLHETLKEAFDLSTGFSHVYWIIIFLFMAVIWSASTWLYESRLFSITAFGSLILSFIRFGSLLDAKPELYTLLTGVTALIGLVGVWVLKKWKDDKFALPLFIAAQLTQAIIIISSLSIFALAVSNSAHESLWNLAALFTWILGAGFYIFSNLLYPFFAFPWLAAATLIPMPWFINTAFELKELGSAIILFGWGGILAFISEPIRRFERIQKYSLPILLASLPGLALAIFFGFVHEVWLGLVLALAAAVILSILHSLQTRWWLWTLALFNMVIAYFAFFQLEAIQKLDIFIGHQLAGITILFLLPDLFLKKDWKENPQWRMPLRLYGVLFLFLASFMLVMPGGSRDIAVGYGALAIFCAIYAILYRAPLLGYIPAVYLPLTIIYSLKAFDLDAWLPALTGLAVLYYLGGVLLRKNEKWSGMLRNSGMALGTIVAFTALGLTKETGGWYALVIGLFFVSEMYLRRSGWFEVGVPILFTVGGFLILHDFDVTRTTYHLLTYSLVWILTDLIAHLTFANPRPLKFVVRAVGGLIALTNYFFLFAERDASIAAIGFAVYALLFLTVSLLYRQPNLFYTFTLTLPLFVTFLFRSFDITRWIHPVIGIAILYYAAGYMMRKQERLKDWGTSLAYSGLGVGVVVSIGAPILGGLDASIPVAIAATLWAVEAFGKRNAWLAFPANALYLLGYFIILLELNVDEPQFFSVGTALLGLIQHYLLTRAESKTGTFIMGMFSQFVLLGTTYIEMINRNELSYFFLLFVQSLVVLVYGLIIRSRSLTFFPIGFVVLGVITVVYSALKGIGTIFVIGCTGILLLVLGVVAVLLRERIAKLGEKLSEWKA